MTVLPDCVADASEPNDNFQLATVISDQGNMALMLCPQDADFFKFQTYSSGTFQMTVSFATPSAVNMRVTAYNGVTQIGTWTGSGSIPLNFAVVAATYYITIVDVNNNQYTPYSISWNINVAPITSSPLTTSPLTSGIITTGRRVTTGRVTTGRTTGLVTTEFPNSGRAVTTFHSTNVRIISLIVLVTGSTTGTGLPFTTGPLVTTDEMAVKSNGSKLTALCYLLLVFTFLL